jgi:hypothetical protein
MPCKEIDMATPTVMSNFQQSQAASWTVAPGEARPLEIGPGSRWLRVTEGRLWLTVPGTADEPAQDVWLESGDGVALPAGAQAVLEAWPSAQFQLLVPPDACRRGKSLAQRLSEQFASRLGSSSSPLPHAA